MKSDRLDSCEEESAEKLPYHFASLLSGLFGVIVFNQGYIRDESMGILIGSICLICMSVFLILGVRQEYIHNNSC